ncbi:hypothetical protein BJY04DRAFT_216450 [Aspergillus karnatakaensis]|uniref:uncharacterized protein n=1 Tax=Aspergillus karnatakaensis TaxID=1810916 RepID=UPI003CCD68F6
MPPPTRSASADLPPGPDAQLIIEGLRKLLLAPPRCPVFIGEIIHTPISRWYPTELFVITKDNEILDIAFDFPRDSDIATIQRHLLTVGYTVLILNGVLCQMPAGGDGAVVSNPRFVKILPCSLAVIRTLAERISLLDSVDGGTHKCYRCGAENTHIQTCPLCQMFPFCYGGCQALPLVQDNHDIDCAILRDPDMAALFRKDWRKLTEFMWPTLNPQSLIPLDF